MEIFKNYSEPGYDIGIRNNRTNKKVKIEVKTRQHIVTTTAEKSKKTCHFTLTENEWKCADFLVGYWMDYDDYFIVPTTDLVETRSKDKLVYKIVFSRLSKPKSAHLYSDKMEQFLNNWNQIILRVEGENELQ